VVGGGRGRVPPHVAWGISVDIISENNSLPGTGITSLRETTASDWTIDAQSIGKQGRPGQGRSDDRGDRQTGKAVLG